MARKKSYQKRVMEKDKNDDRHAGIAVRKFRGRKIADLLGQKKTRGKTRVRLSNRVRGGKGLGAKEKKAA